MSKTRIQTNLIGRRVQIITADQVKKTWGSGGHFSFREEFAGESAEIVNVYLDRDSEPCYDLLFANGELWTNCFCRFFRILD